MRRTDTVHPFTSSCPDMLIQLMGFMGTSKWNRRYVNTPTCKYRDQIGLAETFDMQGREDIGDMIREYYHNVVEEEE